MFSAVSGGFACLAGVALPSAVSSPVHRYRAVRQTTEALTRALTPEDQLAQSMPDASPTKWHLAHTTWFFETFMLTPHLAGYRLFDPRFGYLFNSYYEAVGPRQPRPARGLITRPSAADVLAYFEHPGTSNGPTEAINGRLEHLRGSALGFRNLTNYIARSLLETGGFRPRLHPALVKSRSS